MDCKITPPHLLTYVSKKVAFLSFLKSILSFSLILSFIIFTQNEIFAQVANQKLKGEIRTIKNERILLEKFQIPIGYVANNVNSIVYVNYNTGNKSKFIKNIIFAAAGVALTTKRKKTTDISNSSAKIPQIYPFGIGLSALSGIWKNRPKIIPKASLLIEHKDHNGKLLASWEQTITKEAKNSAELLSINIDKLITSGTIEIYLQNKSNNSIYFWADEVSKNVKQLKKGSELNNKVQDSVLQKVFKSNEKGTFVDIGNPELIVNEKQAKEIDKIRFDTFEKNKLNKKTQIEVSNFRISKTKGPIIKTTTDGFQFCVTRADCSTIVWSQCYYYEQNGLKVYTSCKTLFTQNDCQAATVCYEINSANDVQTLNNQTPPVKQLPNKDKLPPRTGAAPQINENTCVLMTMEWIAKYFSNNSINETSILNYGLQNGKNYIMNGVETSDLGSLVNNFFNAVPINQFDIIFAVGQGYPVMGTINNGRHEVIWI